MRRCSLVLVSASLGVALVALLFHNRREVDQHLLVSEASTVSDAPAGISPKDDLGGLGGLATFPNHCAATLPKSTSAWSQSVTATVALPHEKFDVLGPVCLRGRSVYRLISPHQYNASLASSGHSQLLLQNRTWKGWWTSIQIPPMSHDELQRLTAPDHSGSGSAVSHVDLHASLLLLVAPAYQMFHAWFDGAVPAASFLMRFDQGSLLSVPRDVVSMYIDGKPRSAGAENATLMVLRELGRSARHLLPEDDAQTQRHVDCYCGAVLLGSNFFANIDVRQSATTFLTKLLYDRFKLPPHGTNPAAVWQEMVASGANHVLLWQAACSIAASAPPRLLLLRRKHTRRLGQCEEIAAIAREVGFCVLVFESEGFTTEVQLRVARLADMIVGVHGQGLSWMIFMDAGQAPASSCRRVLELQHFGRQLLRRNDVYVMLAQDCRLLYDKLKPVDVQFGKTVANPTAERRGLMKAVFPYDFKGFYDQTVMFDLAAVRRALERHFAELQACLVRS